MGQVDWTQEIGVLPCNGVTYGKSGLLSSKVIVVCIPKLANLREEEFLRGNKLNPLQSQPKSPSFIYQFATISVGISMAKLMIM